MFKNRRALGAFRSQRPLTYDFGDLKLRDSPKLCSFKLIMTKSNFKKSVMTLFQWRHRYCVTERRHQTNVVRFYILGPSQSKFLATPVAKEPMVQ